MTDDELNEAAAKAIRKDDERFVFYRVRESWRGKHWRKIGENRLPDWAERLVSLLLSLDDHNRDAALTGVADAIAEAMTWRASQCLGAPEGWEPDDVESELRRKIMRRLGLRELSADEINERANEAARLATAPPRARTEAAVAVLSNKE